ncbi:MAG: membrane integrity-associated transporter subunit PqiC [Deltaproteobacteria bacterium]|nr:membrane integrity-associated transporter subunit PqiC [Deltaproteobacteria bacterium]
MERNMRAFICCLGLLLTAGACLDLEHPRNRVQHYTLDYPPPEITGLRPLPVVLKVQRFTVAPAYNSTRIIFGEDRSFRRDEYFYHKWRSNPGDLVTYFLGRDLRESGLFRAVLPHNTELPFSYLLEGSVDEFLELDEARNWYALLSITVTLMAANEPDVSKLVLFQKSYRAKKVCPHKNPRALAQAMSLALGEISRGVIADIYALLKNRM